MRLTGKLLVGAAVLMALAGLAVSPASAGLVVTVQVQGLGSDSGHWYSNDASLAAYGQAGAVTGSLNLDSLALPASLSFRVIAYVVDGNAILTDDKFQSIYLGFNTDNNNVAGNLVAGAITPTFLTTTANAGTAQNLDGDTYDEIGGLLTTDTAGWFFARQASLVANTGATPALWELGSFSMTPISAIAGANTTVAASLRNASGGATYVADNVTKNGTSTPAPTFNSATLSVAGQAPVPEPATMLLLAMGGIGMIGTGIARRRGRK